MKNCGILINLINQCICARNEGVVFQELDSDDSCRRGLDRGWEVAIASLFALLRDLRGRPTFRSQKEAYARCRHRGSNATL